MKPKPLSDYDALLDWMFDRVPSHLQDPKDKLKSVEAAALHQKKWIDSWNKPKRKKDNYA